MTWNAERGEGILDQGQLRGRAVFGKVAAEKAKLCRGARSLSSGARHHRTTGGTLLRERADRLPR